MKPQCDTLLWNPVVTLRAAGNSPLLLTRSFGLWIRAAFLFLLAASNLSAIEPWADQKLTVTNGLEIWLDASKEIASRVHTTSSNGSQNPAATKLINGGRLDILHNAADPQRNFYQPTPEARPRLIQTPNGAILRFDGVDDFLFSARPGKALEEATVFIMAAPRSNKTEFGAFLAFNAEGQNDYLSGLNIDLANGSRQRFDFLNVEGSGFPGVQNLMTSFVPLGETHVLTITAEAGTNLTQAWIDGVPQEKLGKPFPEKLRSNPPGHKNIFFGFDQITIGARYFSNTLEPAHVQGFLDGDISEVLIYDRVLTDPERIEVENYLKRKLGSRIEGRTLALLNAVTNPPPVQMFVPGFSVREIPVSLNNINGVKYREDGKLVALGYDGGIWLLSGAGPDGLETKATLFWKTNSLRSPIGMALTPPDYPRGRGVFVSSKGKFSLIVDTNRDDVADEEIIVASGWKEAFHSVDALGAAVAKDGSIYFGIGTVNFADAYVINKETGKSTYDLKDERGTILRVAPDFSRRDVVCTGIRFPVAMAFNAQGDLFCTDQEGATWLPNGNPLDELLYIEPGKHYGFPPRHPKHLPSVIDEPSVFDYGPQHQSTCGLNFNEPVNGGPVFGPDWWRGDALVSGESRGKLYRTKLVKTGSGYVAQNQVIAALNMITVDACVSPQGDLVVAVHSGKPDWGSGPTGVGKLYKISYSDKNSPQPIAIWPVSPTETEIAFDRPLDVAQVKNLAQQISVTQGKYVSEGDAYESIRPGYQAIQNQLLEPRYVVKILSTALSGDERSLLIRTESREAAVRYAVSLPRGTRHDPPQKEKELPQHPTIELAHDLTGVEAEWQNGAGTEKNSIWLPHLDFTVARAFSKASAAHNSFWAGVAKPGTVKIRTQLDLWQMLRSATQPISKLDFEYPGETVTVVLKSNSPLRVSAPGMKIEQLGANELRLTATPRERVWFPIEITLQHSVANEPTLDASWFTAEDLRPRPLPLRRFFVPWAVSEQINEQNQTERHISEIAGGNWLSGKNVFQSDQAACSKCHTFGSSGAKIGPDLSNLLHRDYASVLNDITQPNAAINPDHVAYTVELKNGESLTGVLVGSNETESRVADGTGKITVVPAGRIASMTPSIVSLMPEGLLESLSAQQQKDLLTFLLMPAPLEPAPIERTGEPPLRELVEVNAILKKSSNPTIQPYGGLSAAKPLRIVLCSGPKDHGPGEHDYPLWQKRWAKLLGLAENILVEPAENWPTREQFVKSDVIVFYSNNPGWSVERATELDTFLNRGGGLVYLHYAVDGHEHCEELAKRIGLAWRGGTSKFRHGRIDLKFQSHPISAGFSETQFEDESYWNLTGSVSNIEEIASGVEENKLQPLMWTREQGRGRVFVSIPGHYTWTFDDPFFRLLIFRGIAWSAHESLDRFNELVTIGARLNE